MAIMLINGDQYERANETRRRNADTKKRAAKRKRGGKKMAKKRGKLRGAAKRAFLRRMAAGRRKAAGGSAHKKKGVARKKTRRASPSTRRVIHRSPTVAAKKKSSRKRRATSGTRRRSTRRKSSRRRRSTAVTFRRVTGKVYRTNPGLGGIGRKLMGAAKKGAIVTLSRAAVNIVSRFLPLGQSVPMRVVAQVVATGAIGWAGEKFLGRETGELAMIGGFDALYTSLIRNMNVPIVGAALGDDVIQGYYLGGSDMGAYYDAGRSTLPAGSPGIGEYFGDDAEAALITQ